MFQGSEQLLDHFDVLAHANVLTYIRNHILQSPELSEEELIQQLMNLNPALDGETLKNKLRTPMQTTMAAFPWLMGRAQSGLVAQANLKETGLTYLRLEAGETPSNRLGRYLQDHYGSKTTEVLSNPEAMVLTSAHCSLGDDLRAIAKSLAGDLPPSLEISAALCISQQELDPDLTLISTEELKQTKPPLRKQLDAIATGMNLSFTQLAQSNSEEETVREAYGRLDRFYTQLLALTTPSLRLNPVITPVMLASPNHFFANQSQPLFRDKIDLLVNALMASLYVNPRSLGYQGQMDLLLGQLYDEFSTEQGSRLPKTSIPSHVNGANTSASISFVDLPVGSCLGQFLRPNGWVGNYFAIDMFTKPSELGIADQISDPEHPGQLRDRILAQVVVIAPIGKKAAFSKARPVVDFWSQEGNKIDCVGGGDQLYLPITSAQKSECLAIVEPEPGDFNYHQLEEIRAVARKNGMECLTKAQLLKDRGIELKPFEQPKTTLPTQADDLLDLAHQASVAGDYQMMIKALKQYLGSQGVSHIQKHFAEILLGAYCGLTGNFTEAQAYLEDFIERDNKAQRQFKAGGAAYKENGLLLLLAQLHLARSEPLPQFALEKFENCLRILEANRLAGKNNPAASDALLEQHRHTLEQVIHLDQAIIYNRLATESQPYDEFDEQGLPIEAASRPGAKAALRCAKIKPEDLPVMEQMIYHLEHGRALVDQRGFKEAIQHFAKAQDCLTRIDDSIAESEIQQSDHAYMKFKLERDILAHSLQICLGLCLFKVEKYGIEMPEQFKHIDPQTFIQEIRASLKKAPSMTVAQLFRRWAGDGSSLFVEGWYYAKDEQAKNEHRGGELYEVYREYNPLDLNDILRGLENNTLTELSLNCLGYKPPVGITETQFDSLCEALAKNTSLSKVYLRKFSDKALEGVKDGRPAKLFKALAEAQSKGQRLTYLGYSGARFVTESDFANCLAYLQANKTLQVLDLSWHDWQGKDVQDLASAIGQHTGLVTIYTGINNYPGSGQAFYEACRGSSSLRHVRTFDGKFNADQKNAEENRDYLHKLDEELKQKAEPKSTLALS